MYEGKTTSVTANTEVVINKKHIVLNCNVSYYGSSLMIHTAHHICFV